MGETLSLLVRGFNSQTQHPRETDDQFEDELQAFNRKVLSVHLQWKAEVNETLKSLFPFQLHDPYPLAMAHNFLQTQGKEMKFTQIHAKCIFMFGSQSKKVKVNAAAHNIDESTSTASEEQTKSHFQMFSEKKKKHC